MKETRKLISLRVSERDWDDFMALADSRGSNASAEINRFIKQSLGRIDSDIQPVNTIQNVNTDNLATVESLESTRQDLEDAIAALRSQVDRLEGAIEPYPGVIGKLRSEIESLKESEPVS